MEVIMKYAVPVSGGVMCSHFGHCEQFALIDVDEKNKEIIRKELVTAPEHEPGLFPKWLAEKGAARVIAGGMGMRAQGLFRENGIEVIVGAMESDPEKAVLNHLSGSLTTGNNVCDH
jgi:ATP-binding protein involved in chromosome partitioning